jgi:glycine oxidase
MFAVASNPERLSGALVTPDCYMVPRTDGRILVGATVERVGFTPGPTPGGIAGLVAAAGRVLPALLEWPLTETWAGYRPGTPDDLPILGPDPDAERLFHATGHFRNGILLAPITAEIVAALVLGRRPPLDLTPFSAERA